MPNKKVENRIKRKKRIRSKIQGTAERPRLAVQRSLMHTYASLINDETGKVLGSTSDMKIAKGTKVEKAAEVGAEIAKKAKELKITTVVFDRNGYKYHGRVKAVAEAAREGGLKF